MIRRWAARLWVSLIFLGVSFGALRGFSSAQDMGATGVPVATWQYNTHRTGLNSNESALLYNNLITSNFGQLCAQQLDGQVYAQPLVMTNVAINKVSVT